MLDLGHSLFVGLIFKNPVRYDSKIRYLNPNVNVYLPCNGILEDTDFLSRKKR